jgi:hypothetical protein
VRAEAKEADRLGARERRAHLDVSSLEKRRLQPVQGYCFCLRCRSRAARVVCKCSSQGVVLLARQSHNGKLLQRDFSRGRAQNAFAGALAEVRKDS